MWTVVYLVLIADIVHSAGKYYFRLYGDKKFKKCLIECKRDYGKQKEVLECSCTFIEDRYYYKPYIGKFSVYFLPCSSWYFDLSLSLTCNPQPL
ncbi:hypothetical protein CRM22_001225 [Opisthorchis felineus]|uniref:Uncharacterized protein n=1 Tax=Opisthorchis felineus TaxID=147828 RepID=A0A4S2MI40_OPIFE|nr:hypothetical protein CRM22_001225 [Opisthorchis felineus]